MTDVSQARLNALYGRLNYERHGMPPDTSSLRLGRLRRFLRTLGDPQKTYRIVHVAGTKGKGSTATLIAAALVAAGHRTGVFTSPHLHRLEERFVVDGQAISSDRLNRLIEALEPSLAQFESTGPPLTFFEVTTALGLVYFAQEGCRAVVLEVGMGGRLDSTNIVRPAVSVLTSISLDHVQQLGPTIRHIAVEKAGIIKRGRPVVSGVTAPEAALAIREISRTRRAPLREVGSDFDVVYQPPTPPIERPTPGSVRVTTWRTGWSDRPVPIPGAHQANNAALALATLDALAEVAPELAVDDQAARQGFAQVQWPARMEVLGNQPWIVIDGAHNADSAQALAETLATCFPNVPRTLVFGTSREKDAKGQLDALLPLFDQVILTKYLENPRAEAPETIAQSLNQATVPPLRIESDPKDALKLAKSLTPPNALICVTGSLFLVAEIRAILLGLTEAASTQALV